MVKKVSFNFGANAKPKKSSSGKKSNKGTKSGAKSNVWRAYTGGGISNAPIPD